MDTDVSSADASFIGYGTSNNSGTSISAAGDVNGDGYDDFLIGAIYFDDDYDGEVYLVLGKAAGWSFGASLSTAAASYYNEEEEDRVGMDISGVGDVNGDGFDDFVIGDPSSSTSGAYRGQAFLIFGKEGGWALHTALSSADASFIGEANYDYAGESVSGVGDVNGDGYTDMVIGAKGNDAGGDASGQTYLILGKQDGWAQATNIGTAASASFWGEEMYDISGVALGGGGDLNGDGYADILIGAPQSDYGGQGNVGQTYVVFGKNSGWGMDTDLSLADASFIGGPVSNIGGGLDIVDDLNADGCDDIIISNLLAATWSGKTYLSFGCVENWSMDMLLSNSDAVYLGEVSGDRSGWSISGVGDINDDGYGDFVVGADNNDEGGSDSGQAYLIFGGENYYQVAGLSALAVVDENSRDVEVGSAYGLTGVNTVVIQDLFEVPVSRVNANFTDDLNWTAVTGGTDMVSNRSFIHGIADAPGVSSYSLLVPKDSNDEYVGYCPTATSLAEVVSSCASHEVLTDANPNVAIVTIDGQDYWEISAVGGSGGYSISRLVETGTETFPVITLGLTVVSGALLGAVQLSNKKLSGHSF